MIKTRVMLFLSILSLLNTPAVAKDKTFYFKTIAGFNKNSDIKTVDSDINFILIQKANLSPVFGFGIGYYVNSFARFDVTFENTDIAFATNSSDFKFIDNGILHFGQRSIKRKANIQSVMFNGYIDIIRKPTYSIFVGTGLGIGTSRIKEKTFDRFDSNIIINGDKITLPVIYTSSTNKNKNTFSYALIIGSDFNVCQNFNIELAYSWKYSGKVKVIDNINNKYQGHNLSATARFDL